MIVKCFHCGNETSNDNHSKDISGGICSICWKLHEEIRQCQKNNMQKTAEEMKLTLELRRKLY
ncbi:MAG: hypothetical protein U9Q16_02065 [Patescibacteria group bacterium]|nr:hypothetical protein [Patescibacteria group bacterium]